MTKKLFFLIAVLFIVASFSFKVNNNGNDNDATSSSASTATETLNDDQKRAFFEGHIFELYENLEGAEIKPELGLFRKSMIGLLNLKAKRKLPKENIISIVDFRLPSYKERMWIIDLDKREILFHTFCSHGRNTGYVNATEFSNEHETFKSSLGFYVTANTYYGKHGLSLRLDGMEYGYNNNARARAIVLHAAKYASKWYADKYKRIGRSLGCPAIPFENRTEVINKLANGTTIFIYAEKDEYHNRSKLITDEDGAMKKFYLANSI